MKKDQQRHLLGFNNGVYDLDLGRFRDGLPEDYITMTTGYDYYPPDENSRVLIEQVQTFMEQILPIYNVRKFVLQFLASCLSGRVSGDHLVPIWIGTGGNGKSILVRLMENALGEYAGKMPVSLITKARSDSASASPEVSANVLKRFVPFQEPDTNVVLM